MRVGAASQTIPAIIPFVPFAKARDLIGMMATIVSTLAAAAAKFVVPILVSVVLMSWRVELDGRW